MSAKRFIQLFVFYFLSIIIAIPITKLFPIKNAFLAYFVISLIGYTVLTLPLTVMTIKKEKQKKKDVS